VPHKEISAHGLHESIKLKEFVNILPCWLQSSLMQLHQVRTSQTDKNPEGSSMGNGSGAQVMACGN